MTRDLDILGMEFNECWNIFKTQIEREDPIYEKVRFGISIKFDIYDYLKNYIIIRGMAGKVAIRNKGSFNLTDFNTELEIRENEMKAYLLETLGTEDVATPRGMGEQ